MPIYNMDKTMAISLPQYKQQAQPVADTTARKLPADLTSKAIMAEAQVGAAMAEGFATVAKVGGQLAFQYRDTHNKAVLAKLSNDDASRLSEYKNQISIINDEDELARYRKEFELETEKRRNETKNNIYGGKAQRQLDVLADDFLSKTSILDTDRAFNIEVDKLAAEMFMYRENAENNQIMINPETGQLFEPEYELADDGVSVKVDENFQGVESKTAAQVQDEYATNELLRLNKITAQAAAQRKSQFGQNIEYKRMRNIINFDIDNFIKEYDPTKLSAEQNLSIQGLLKQAENEINTKTVKLNLKSFAEAGAKVADGTIDIPAIEKLEQTTVEINGKEIPVISKELGDILKAEVTGRANAAKDVNKTEYESIGKMITELDPEDFSMGKINKIYKKMYKVEKGVPKALFPIEQIRLWKDLIQLRIGEGDVTIDFANGALFTGKDKLLTPPQKELFTEIFDMSRDMLRLDDDPLLKLPKGTTVGTAIERTQNAQAAFIAMIKEQKDPRLGKVLTIDEFREEYIVKNQKIDAEIKALNLDPPSTITEVTYKIGEIISDGKGGFAKIINLDGIENGLNESHVEFVDEDGNPLPFKITKRSRATASQERFRP